MMRPYVIGIDHRKALNRDLVGGKAYGLARLRRYGFNVPETAVITIPAVKKYLTSLSKWSGPFAGDHSNLPAATELETAILQAYHKIDSTVAIRSSFRDEDGDKSSFAGQLDSILSIESEGQLIFAVRQCCRALLNPHLEVYVRHFLKKFFSPDQTDSLALIIQKMVPAYFSGVAFSYDPFNHTPQILIEATSGLGHRLVGGKVNPDRYRVDLKHQQVEQYLQQPDRPFLTKGQILELATQVNAIAMVFKQHQDIEWAWDGSRFHFLQTRPVTYHGSGRIYSSKLVSDMTPGLIKPLLWSTNIQDMTLNVFGRVFTNIIGPNPFDFTQLIKRIHSRAYSDLTLFGEIFESIGLPPNFFEIIARDEMTVKKQPRFSIRFLHTLLRLIRFMYRHARSKTEILSFIMNHQTRLENFRFAVWEETGLPQLLDAIRELRKYHGETQWFMWIGAINMTLRNKMLKRLVKKHAPHVQAENLISGMVGLKSLEPNRELKILARQVQAIDPVIRQKIVYDTNTEIRRVLSGLEQGLKILQLFDRFMQRYGFLSINGTDFSISPWIENPDHIWQGIFRLLPVSAEFAESGSGQVRILARQQVESSLNRIQKFYFAHLFRSTIEYIDLRERMTFFMSEDAYQMRRIYLAMGNLLRIQNVLAATEDIFFMHFDEIEDAVAGKSMDGQIKVKLSLRKTEMMQDQNLELNDIISSDSPQNPFAQPAEGTEFLTGITGSPGIIKGIARIVMDPADIHGSFTREDILVVPFTDVGWTLLFPSIGGIIAETGGQLSHSAIVAREYGLPALVSVRKATRLIKNGQALLLDASQGRVYLNVSY